MEEDLALPKPRIWGPKQKLAVHQIAGKGLGWSVWSGEKGTGSSESLCGGQNTRKQRR